MSPRTLATVHALSNAQPQPASKSTEPWRKQLTSSPEQATKYSGFSSQFVAGDWRPGKAGKTLADHNPYNGEVLTEISQANADDVDDADRAAALAQSDWAATIPSKRS